MILLSGRRKGRWTTAAAIFVFVYSWDEYFFALIFTTQNAKTAPLVINEMVDAIYGMDWGVLFAGVTIPVPTEKPIHTAGGGWKS